MFYLGFLNLILAGLNVGFLVYNLTPDFGNPTYAPLNVAATLMCSLVFLKMNNS